MQDLALGLILAGTVVALYLRPLGATDWQVALAGAAAAWLVGPLSVTEGVASLRDSANIICFFFGLMLIAAGAEAAGLYSSAARLLAGPRTVCGRTALVLVAAACITAILSNDATPLVLTPAIFAAAGGNRTFSRSPAFAATFMADGASLLLPVSNPVNLLFFDRFDLSFAHYLLQVSIPAIAGAAALGTVAWLRTRESSPALSSPSPIAVLSEPQSRLPLPALAVVALLAAAYVAAGLRGWPLGAVTLAGGLAMALAARSQRRFDLARYRKHIAPGVLVFVASLLLLVANVEEAGLLGRLGDLLEQFERAPGLVTILGAAAVATVLANLLNNWPSALLLAATIAAVPGTHDQLVVGTLIGSTIGANFTMVGSLSTVFWLSLNRQAAEAVAPAEYMRRAFLPTLAGVFVACLVAATVV